jgi:hypothetical protein
MRRNDHTNLGIPPCVPGKVESKARIYFQINPITAKMDHPPELSAREVIEYYSDKYEKAKLELLKLKQQPDADPIKIKEIEKAMKTYRINECNAAQDAQYSYH